MCPFPFGTVTATASNKCGKKGALGDLCHAFVGQAWTENYTSQHAKSNQSQTLHGTGIVTYDHEHDPN